MVESVNLLPILSIAILIGCGYVASVLCRFSRVPYHLGLLIAGFCLQFLLNDGLLHGCEGGETTPSIELRSMALVLVLVRAGLGIKLHEIKTGGLQVGLMLFIPYFIEWAIVTASAISLLGWNFVSAGMLSSIISAVGPSLVIASMLAMREAGYKKEPTIPLVAVPIEAINALILFDIMSGLESSDNLPVYAQILLIPVNIINGLLLGIVLGALGLGFIKLSKSNNRHARRSFLGTPTEQILVVLVLCLAAYGVCNNTYAKYTSGVCAVFACAITISHFGKDWVDPLKVIMNGIWVFGEIFLFVLLGAATSPEKLSRTDGNLVALVFIGTLARLFVYTCITTIAQFIGPGKRYRSFSIWWRESLFLCIVCMPKATVQAALGSIPLAKHLLSGPDAISHEQTIETAAVITVVIMAPLGVVLTRLIGFPLAKQLEAMKTDIDNELAAKTATKPGSPAVRRVVHTADSTAKPPGDDQTLEDGNGTKMQDLIMLEDERGTEEMLTNMESLIGGLQSPMQKTEL